ncbi:MAG TPA: hypothetical protein P5323_01700 [Candidatus Moranbacteria bacterium]|nr:hypothetical protein [Candidatus Moranbacteria bacterium]HRY27829.1 hypothetical protein [Candidatus Moranbacteria bacterium]HSA08711.1 hypothetical protein [Candidatus Moranbacteria bacterium]
MKRALLGVVVIGAALVLSGCGKPASVDQNTVQKQAPQQEVAEEKSSFSDITEAMKSGKKMECVSAAEADGSGVKTTMQFDGKNYKSVTEVGGKKTYSVMKDEVMYTWGEGLPTATKLSVNCLKDLPKTKVEGQEAAVPAQNPEKAFENASSLVCKPIASVDVSVPSDVQFQDMCEMMKGMMNKIPAGTTLPDMSNLPKMP